MAFGRSYDSTIFFRDILTFRKIIWKIKTKIHTGHLVWAGPVHLWILVESWPNLARIPAWVCMAVEFVSAPAVNKDPCTNPPMTDVCYRHIKVLQWKRMRADKNQANLSPYLSALNFLTFSSSKYVSSLKLWKYSLFQTWISQAAAGRKIKFKLKVS